jgi:hypothetical protein
VNKKWGGPTRIKTLRSPLAIQEDAGEFARSMHEHDTSSSTTAARAGRGAEPAGRGEGPDEGQEVGNRCFSAFPVPRVPLGTAPRSARRISRAARSTWVSCVSPILSCGGVPGARGRCEPRERPPMLDCGALSGPVRPIRGVVLRGSASSASTFTAPPPHVLMTRDIDNCRVCGICSVRSPGARFFSCATRVCAQVRPSPPPPPPLPFPPPPLSLAVQDLGQEARVVLVRRQLEL